MSSAPIVDRIRIIPRPDDFLDRNVGSSGEVFFNRATNSLRVYSGKDRAGFEIARADLTNVSDSELSARIAELGISAAGGASVDVGITVPETPTNGNLWLNTENGRLYIYINDGDTSQWIQPAVPTFSGNYDDLSNKPALFSGNYIDLQNRPSIPASINDLLDVDTETSLPSTGQILKWNGSRWAPAADIAESGAGTDAATLDGEQPTYYLDYTNFTNTPTSFNNLTLTGLTTLQQSAEVLSTLTGATGTVTHDFSQGAVWYHTTPADDFTANFSNVPTLNGRVLVVALIIQQGSTARIPTAVQINGASQTVNWNDTTVPTGNADQVDLVSFSFIRTSSTWTVLGSLSTYG